MKIIKRVEPVNTFTKVCTCQQCGSELEVNANDLQYRAAEGGNPHDYYAECFFVSCAVCFTDININSGEIPSLVKRAARERHGSKRTWDR